MPVDGIFITLTCIIIIRTFFEMLLGGGHSLQFNPDFYINIVAYTHIYLSWLCVFLTAGILLTLFLKLKYIDSLKLILLFSPLIVMVPLFDFVFIKGTGGQILYSFKLDTFLYTYLNGFNPFADISTGTRGARIEVLIAFLGSFYISYYVFGTGCDLTQSDSIHKGLTGYPLSHKRRQIKAYTLSLYL
jgi:hypothetical protein